MTTAPHELSLTRLIAAPRAALFRCWTEPELIKQWFTPRPWTTPVVEMDVRPGGSSHMIFRGPEGQEFPNDGIFLEIIPNERLVFTDAYTSAWVPSAKPFMTAIITFADE
ncbi:MAG: SRPBCC domain-containing protein, partial [Alphaproteobacteria bacterium]|nr:SRPBCC domain-containing protein [Alphaproteobacteria bacterium]